jgi:hypothetical protein
MFIDEVIKDIPTWTDLSQNDLQEYGISIPKNQINGLISEYQNSIIQQYLNTNVILLPEGYLGKITETPGIIELEKLKLPFDSVFIDIPNKDKGTIGISVTKKSVVNINNVDLDITVFVKHITEENISVNAVFINMAKLPRLYFLCDHPCDMLNESHSIQFSGHVCMKTERVANCPVTIFVIHAIKCMIHVINSFNNPSVEKFTVEVPASKVKSGNKVSRSKRSVIYINPVKRVYERKEPTGTHSSPVPHSRRGHYRHLKSGKLIWVKEAYVKGSNDRQKVYKLNI